MGKNFIACDREQSFLLPPDVREWLPEDHFAWFVLDAVGQMDLAAFYGAYRADGHGRAAFDPGMVVALLLYFRQRPRTRWQDSSGGSRLRENRQPLPLFVRSSSGSHLTADCNRRAAAATEGAGFSCGASGHAVTSYRVIRQAPIRSGRTIQMTSEVPACAHWVALMTYSVIWPRARA